MNLHQVPHLVVWPEELQQDAHVRHTALISKAMQPGTALHNEWHHLEAYMECKASLHTSACLPLSCGTMSLYVSSLPVGRGESAALAELAGISCMPRERSDGE